MRVEGFGFRVEGLGLWVQGSKAWSFLEFLEFALNPKAYERLSE